MADDIKAIFASVKEEAKDFSTALWKCCEKIYNELPQNYEADIDPELQLAFLTDKLNQAVKTLCNELEKPTLILATTGTTSSGKSTLVNLLCGAELMPRAVLERSAGVVTVEYSEQKAVKIEETAGATWECGTWHDISNEDIYDRLDKVMKAYLKHRAAGDSHVACPQSTVYYPFRLVADSDLLKLPEGTTVKIMDLPGLAHVGDEGNAEVIRKSKEALCLVTYNSAETDEKKVTSLLQEVVEQVKELGGSPARMLFVLNRIDVFRGDEKDWPENEEAFFDKTSQDIRSKLKESLGEYKQEIDNAKIIKLSSLPALLALKIIDGSDAEKNEAADALDSHFNFLMSEDVLDDLPRNVRKWTDHDRKRLSDVVWKESNAEAFHQHLKQHIQNKYPQLILPQIIEKFKDDAAFKLIEWASQTTSAVINSSEERYQAECERIKDIQVNLDQSIKQKEQALKKPFDDIEKFLQDVLNKKEGAEDPIHKLAEILGKSDCFGPGISGQLTPLFDWSIVLASAIKNIVSSILKALIGGRSILGDKAFEYAKPTNVTLLDGRIKDLVKENYLNYAGKKFQAQTQEEKEKLEKLNRNLNELSIVLVSVVDDVAKKVLNREINRVENALEKLFKLHLESLKKSVVDIAPDLGINFLQTELINVKFSAIPNFSFKGGFPVVKRSYRESVTEKVGTKRVFLFFKEDVYKTRIEKRSSDNAIIPSFEDLERGWKIQKGDGEKEVLRQVSTWWLKQLEEFNSGIEKFQSDVIERYQERLTLAYQDSATDYKHKMEIWKPLNEEALLVSSRVSALGTEWRSSEKKSKP